MTSAPDTGGPRATRPDLESRDFDYGIGDELRGAEQQVRAEIAARIRRAARLDATATPEEKQIYEVAARIAEGLR